MKYPLKRKNVTTGSWPAEPRTKSMIVDANSQSKVDMFSYVTTYHITYQCTMWHSCERRHNRTAECHRMTSTWIDICSLHDIDDKLLIIENKRCLVQAPWPNSMASRWHTQDFMSTTRVMGSASAHVHASCFLHVAHKPFPVPHNCT